MKFLYLLVAMLSLLAVVLGSSVPDEEHQVGVLSRQVRAKCNPKECDQSCRRIGFPGGACINNFTKCDCDRF